MLGRQVVLVSELPLSVCDCVGQISYRASLHISLYFITYPIVIVATIIECGSCNSNKKLE